MTTVPFNYIPGSGLVAPGTMFEENSGGGFSSVSRLVLIGHKTTAGSATMAVAQIVGSQYDADAACGPGSMLREMFRIARANAPVQEIWVLPVAETGNVQTWTFTIASVAAGVATVDIHGERIQIPVAATDTATTIAAALAAAINAYYNALTNAMLPYTAAAAAGVVTLTARHAGVLFAEVPTYLPVQYPDGIANNIFTSSTVTVASGTAGTGIPSLTTPLANLGDENADLLISPWADSTSLSAYTTWLNDLSGRWSYAHQSYGHVATCNTGSLSAQTTLGLTQNDRHTTIIDRVAGGTTGCPHPPWLWATGIPARVISWLSDYATGNCARNQTGLIVQGLAPARDKTQRRNYPSRNSLLQVGISTTKSDRVGNVVIDKLVSTYQTGSAGQPDTAFRDIQALFQSMLSLRYIRSSIDTQFPNRSLAQSNPGGVAAIATPADIKGCCYSAYKQLVNWGVLAFDPNFINALEVVINGSNGSRIDIFNPLIRTMPLDIFAGNATLYSGSLPTAA